MFLLDKWLSIVYPYWLAGPLRFVMIGETSVCILIGYRSFYGAFLLVCIVFSNCLNVSYSALQQVLYTVSLALFDFSV